MLDPAKALLDAILRKRSQSIRAPHAPAPQDDSWVDQYEMESIPGRFPDHGANPPYLPADDHARGMSEGWLGQKLDGFDLMQATPQVNPTMTRPTASMEMPDKSSALLEALGSVRPAPPSVGSPAGSGFENSTRQAWERDANGFNARTYNDATFNPSRRVPGMPSAAGDFTPPMQGPGAGVQKQPGSYSPQPGVVIEDYINQDAEARAAALSDRADTWNGLSPIGGGSGPGRTNIALSPGLNSNDGDIDLPGEEGTRQDNLSEGRVPPPPVPQPPFRQPPAMGAGLSPSGVRSFGTPLELARNEASRLGSVRDIAAMDDWKEQSQAILAPQIAGAEQKLAQTILSGTPEALNASLDQRLDGLNRPAMERGRFDGERSLDTRSGRGPGGGAREMAIGFPGTQRVGLTGPAATKDPNASSGNDGLPGGKMAFGPELIKGDELKKSMDQYGQFRDAQRKRLAERGMDQRGIDAQMQTGRLGKDNIAGMRAMANESMRQGLSPEQAFAQARVFDNNQAGSYATPEEKAKSVALYEGLLKGPEDRNSSIRDEIGLLAARSQAVNDRITLEKWEKEKGIPIKGSPEDLALQQKQVEAARELDLKDSAAPLTPELEAHAIQQYNRTGVIDPKLSQKFADLHNSRYTGGGDGGGVYFGQYAPTQAGREQDFIDTVNRHYAGRPVRPSEAMIRQWYRSTDYRGNPVSRPSAQPPGPTATTPPQRQGPPANWANPNGYF